MAINNLPSQGLTQNVTIRQGRVTSKDKTADVGAVVKVNRGQEAQAWEAARANGADDIRFRTESGDTYIASGVGFEKLGLQIGNTVDINGVKGRITALDNQANSKSEQHGQVVTSAVIGGAGAGLFGLAIGLMAFPAGAGIAMVGGIALAAGAAVGALFGAFGHKPVINLDRIKLFGSEAN